MRDPGDALEAAEWLAGRMREIRDRVAAARRALDTEYRDWYKEAKRTTDERTRREQRRAEQDALDAAIDDVSSVLRDLIAVFQDPRAGILNEDVRAELVERARGLGPHAEAGLVTALGEVERCRRRLRTNANVLLTLEELFLALYRCGVPHTIGSAPE